MTPVINTYLELAQSQWIRILVPILAMQETIMFADHHTVVIEVKCDKTVAIYEAAPRTRELINFDKKT